jgi:riboflavin synthase
MFTGIVTAIGKVREAKHGPAGLTLKLGAPYPAVRRGESIAVDGACLTVEQVGKGWFAVHVVATSLERTRFGGYTKGQPVNLERALKVGDRLGGHLVQGHVDGVGEVLAVTRQGDAWLMNIRVPAPVAEVSIPLGSITVDGVSLTVNAIPAPGTIQLSLIPFTFQHTTLGAKRPGDGVHLEGDTIGKYVQSLLQGRPPAASPPGPSAPR